jgi:cobalamin biosynthetic protein CobC
MSQPSERRLQSEDALAGFFIAHGGRLDEARRLFPNAPQPWIDLSTGINPRSYPLPEIALQAWTRLPDADSVSRLEQAAARAYAAPTDVEVVAGAGSQSFIQWLPRLVKARRVAILGYSYAEHASRWRAAGAIVEEAASLEHLSRADVAVVVNPNNPDGRLIAPKHIAELGAIMTQHGRLLVIDEAFMDMTPSFSAAPYIRGEAILLRSLGKAYGLAGLRLGFALCNKLWAARLREAMGPWSVSGPALAVGAAALEDAAWLSESAERLRQDARRLDELLAGAGFDIIGGVSLFRLARHERAASMFRSLARSGIWTRSFAEKPTWLRFGIPGDEESWGRVADALRDQQ